MKNTLKKKEKWRLKKIQTSENDKLWKIMYPMVAKTVCVILRVREGVKWLRKTKSQCFGTN